MIPSLIVVLQRMRKIASHTSAGDVCVSRDHEIITGSNKDSGLTFDAAGHLKLTKQDQVEPCNTSNEMLVDFIA